MVKKILLLATGGTIASAQTADGMNPQLTPEDLLAAVPEIAELCTVETKVLMNLDSTNVQPEEWQLIAAECYAALSDYDGIVISHGTDTLAYTSSALSFMLRDPGKPIVLTGSQLSMTEPEGDAPGNLLDSFRVAISDLKGIFVVFDGKVMGGNHTVKTKTHSFDAFDSVNHPLIGTINEGILYLSEFGRDMTAAPQEEPQLSAELEPKVMLIKLTPGFEPLWLESLADLGLRGIIIEAYGFGGLPFRRRDLLSTVEKLLARGLPIALGTQVTFEGTDLTVYEVAVKALRAGVISTGRMTTEATLTKMMWVLGQTADPAEIRELMSKDLARET
jgi:L-asparaginase